MGRTLFHHVACLNEKLHSTLSFFTQVYKWVLASKPLEKPSKMLGILPCNGLASHSRRNTCIVASCDGRWRKVWAMLSCDMWDSLPIVTNLRLVNRIDESCVALKSGYPWTKRLTVLNTAFSTQSNIQFLNASLTNPVTDSCHLFQSPDCKERVQVQRLLLNCPDIGKYTFYFSVSNRQVTRIEKRIIKFFLLFYCLTTNKKPMGFTIRWLKRR